jgi:hypothetical protein
MRLKSITVLLAIAIAVAIPLRIGYALNGSIDIFAVFTLQNFRCRHRERRNGIMGRKKLTTDDQVLQAIKKLSKQMGFPPTCEELRRELHLGSTRTVSRYLASLKESKRIFRWSGSRGIQILKGIK